MMNPNDFAPQPIAPQRKTTLRVNEAFTTCGTARPHHYQIATRGLTAQGIADRVAEVHRQHAVRETKVDAMQSAVGTEIHVNLDTFRVTDAIVKRRGEDWEVVYQVARLVGDRWRRLGPRRVVVGAVENLPSSEEVILLARGHAEQIAMKEIEAQEFATDVSRLLGEG